MSKPAKLVLGGNDAETACGKADHLTDELRSAFFVGTTPASCSSSQWGCPTRMTNTWSRPRWPVELR